MTLATSSSSLSSSSRLVSLLCGPWAFRIAVGWYAVALALGLKRFLVWDQITVLEGSGAWSMLASGHPHTLRWLLLQPAMAFGSWDPHLAFTVMCFFCLVGTTLLLARAGVRLTSHLLDEAALRVWIFLPLALLSLTMNGRLVPAFFGVALLLALHVERAAGVRRHWAWLLAGQALGLLCCAVSSGSFAVGAMAVGWSWCTALAAVRHDPARRVPLLLCVGFALLLLGGMSALLFGKALRFFHDDPLAVLSHGLGAHLLSYSSTVAVVGVLLWTVLATVWWWRWPWPAAHGSHLRVAIWASLVFGLFGYATLVTALPAVLLLVALAVVPPDASDRLG